MLSNCCTRSFARGEVVCPVCETQASEHAREIAEAQTFRQSVDQLSAKHQELLARRAVPAQELGVPTPVRGLALVQRNPSRRTVHRLLGIYLPEREARELLKKIHDFKWIEAEKAGADIWRKREPREPFKAAAQNWATRYLPKFLEYANREAA
jgi:hypothetical protein